MKITKNSKCLSYEPDCENCPYQDCIASYDDVKRQLAYKNLEIMKKRNADIVYAYQHGATLDGLSIKYDMSKSGLLYILRKNGIKIRRGRNHENETS